MYSIYIYIYHACCYIKKNCANMHTLHVTLYIIYYNIQSSLAVKYNGHLDLNKAAMCKRYSSLLASLPPAQRELLLYGYMLLLGLPCSCSGHTTQIQSLQLQPRVLEELPTTFENAEREHAPKKVAAHDGIGYTCTSTQLLATKTYPSMLLYSLSCSLGYRLGVTIR